MQFRSIYIIAKNEAEARKIGKTLIEEKLAACVNFFPVQSIYRWKGKVYEEGETAMIAKTRIDLVDKLVQRVNVLHSYEVPCIVSWIIEKGNPAYLDWIQEETK